MRDVLIGVLVCYVALVGIMYLGQRRMTYFPDPGTPDPARYGVPEMEPVRFDTADGLTLGSWYGPPARPGAPVLVYFHGNAGHIGHRGHRARPYLDAGYGVLLVEYRGYGGNPGDPTEEGLYADGRAALDFLAGQGLAGDQIVLYGESLGTGVAVRLASETRVGAVVLEAPFSSLAEVGARHYWYLPVRWLMRDRFESVGIIARIGAPLLVLYTEHDEVVPPDLSEKLFAAALEPKEIHGFQGVGHNGLDGDSLAGRVQDFLARHLD